MPFQMAMAVAHGRLDLSDALETMARKQRAERLEKEHGLTRALATQVAMGQLDLEVVLRRRRLAEHRRVNRDRTWLEVGRPIVLGVHGRGQVRGTPRAVHAYGVDLEHDGEVDEIHKLLIQYAYDPADWKKVKKAIRTDKSVAAQQLEPVRLPQHRYGCSDKRLFNYVDTGVDVTVCLLEGQLLKGNVTWFSRYEFALRVRTGVEVGVFRHALQRVTS
jgi:sRNA-binding regulator protein Hfq